MMWVMIDPPINGQPFGLGGSDIDELVLATRHEGQTLFPISEWPSYVHCARIVSGQPRKDGFVSQKSLAVIDWGALYPTEEEAKRNRLEDIHRW